MSDSFDRLLARSERGGGPPPGPCPDAGVLAAYLDGTLARTERAALELHAADCARCTLQLATIVRLEDESGHPQRAAARGWWRRVAWIVPAATAVVVAAIYLAVPSRVPPPRPTLDGGSDMAARTSSGTSALEAPAGPAASTQQSRAPAPSTREDDGSASAPARARAKSSASASQKPASPLPAVVAEALAPPAGVQGAAVEAELRQVPPLETPLQHADKQGRGEAAAMAVPVLGRSASVSLQVPEPQAAATLIVRSRDRLVQWRVTGPRIERTADGGRTWLPERTPMLTGVSMGVAPSPTVCWLATPSGRVLRRTEGGEWDEVSPVPAVPLARIESESPRRATLIGIDGIVLTTADGGHSWTRRAPR